MSRERLPPQPHRPGVVRRDPRLPVRPGTVRPRDGRYRRPNERLQPRVPAPIVFAVLVALLIGTPLFVVAAFTGPVTPRDPAVAAGSPTARLSPVGSAGGSAPASSEPSAASTVPPAEARVPLVPVVSYWSPLDAITLDELRAALDGTSEAFDEVMLPSADRAAIGDALGVAVANRVKSGSTADIRSAVRNGALGLLRVSDVTPHVRALGIGEGRLFGTRRVTSLDDWPLSVKANVSPASVFDPARTWTIVAAGDILLDRGVARQVKELDKGVDFPFDGGTVQITGSRCCSGFGHRVPVFERTGNEGAVRALVSGADLALANLESPVDDDFVYHTRGTTFSGDPVLLDGLRNVGLDFVSLANNHIRDAGADGILDTIKELDARRIAHSGAGANFEAAREPAALQARGTKVLVFGCDAIASAYWTRGERVGARRCDTSTLVEDIREAKKSGAVVIVYPHWGVEYRATPSRVQRSQAREWIEAGADVIIGNHAHWPGAIERIEGKYVFYALGNFVFDQMWSEQTMQGLLLELTFDGRRLLQASLHPTLIVDQAQPNLLNRAEDGKRVIDRARKASESLGRF